MLVDLIILGLLAAEVIFLSRLDRRRFGTWLTPFTLLAYPYAAVAVLAYFAAPAFDFAPLYINSVILWMIGLFVVWAAGFFLGWGVLDMRLAPSRQVAQSPVGRSQFDEEAVRWAVVLAWASMPVLVYGVVVCARSAGGWTEIGSENFRDAYSQGLHAHAVVLATLLAVVLIGLRRRGDRWILTTIAMLLVFVLLSRVKGTIMQAVIGGVLFRVMRGTTHFTIKKIALLGLSTYLIFNAVYLIQMSFFSWDTLDGAIVSYLARHYTYYLFAGPLALGQAMRSGVADIGGDWHTIFAPFINLYHFSFGGFLVAAGSTREKGMDTDFLSRNALGTNVYTFFGTLYLYLGALGAILYVLVVALLCYGFLVLVRRQNNPWFTAVYCLIAAQLAVGFFEFYFWHLAVLEIIVLAVLLTLASKARLRLWA